MVGGAFLLKINTNKAEPTKKEVAVIVDSTVKKALAEDSDGDGLKNWEESIRKTDPNLSDTDNDGTNDGDEVKEGRDPLVKGPNDKENVTETDSNSIPKKTPTATDLLSREVFEKYLEAKKNGLDITEELEQQIADAVLNKDYEGDVIYFDQKDLRTSTDTSYAALKNYGNLFGSIVSTPPVPNVPNELVILEKIQTDGITDIDISNLELLAKRYAKIKDGLVKMIVPKGAEIGHTQIIRGVEVMYGFVNGIQTLEKDPIGSLPKIARYEEGLDLLSAGTINIKKYLTDRNITFSSDESGYSLFR
jgi:hypothetical protein